MNKALFEVGELVRTCYPTGRNSSSVEILDLEWHGNIYIVFGNGVKEIYTGWTYLLADREGMWSVERHLKKLPDPGTLSFDQLMEKLNTPVPEECTE